MENQNAEEKVAVVYISSGTKELVGIVLESSLEKLERLEPVELLNPMRFSMGMTPKGPAVLPFIPYDLMDATKSLFIRPEIFFYLGEEGVKNFTDAVKQVSAAEAGIVFADATQMPKSPIIK